jgi:hypothetical protein
VNTVTKSILLSPSREEGCPTVEVDKHEVRIGDTGNLARLTPAEWNVLVRAIRTHALLEL